MIVPFPTVLEVLERTAPVELVSAEALARIAEFHGSLPACSSQVFLECRLRGDEPRVDFMFSVHAATGERSALAAYLTALAPERDTLADRLWRGTRDLCAEWVRPGAFLHEKVPLLWLEFDLLGTPESPPPFTYACVQPGFPQRRLLRAPFREEEDLPRRITLEVLRLLLGGPLPPDVARCVRTCFEALPTSALMMYVAPLACRRMDAIRLSLHVPRTDLIRYLTRIGWPGPLAQVEALVEGTSLFRGGIDFDLDAGATVGPRLGLQLPTIRGGAPRAQWRSLELLDALETCAPAKREALRRWLGRDEVTLPGHRWPTLQNRNVEAKLVITPGAPIEAKVYLDLQHRFSLFSPEGIHPRMERADA